MTNGNTLQSFLAVSESTLSDGLTDQVVLDAAHSDSELADFLRSSKWPKASSDLAERLSGFLQGDATEVFAGAWSKCSGLKKAVAESRAHPGEPTFAGLTDYDFNYELRPSVDVLVDGVRLGSIQFVVTLACDVSALELEIRDGAVGGIRVGSASGKAEIACGETTIWERELVEVSLPGVLQFKRPIRV